MGDHIRNAHILIVADTRNDGQRELRYITAQTIGVEAAQIACRTASSDDDHSIELLHALRHSLQSLAQRLLSRLALHHGIEELHTKGVTSCREFVAEVAVACGSTARNNGHTLNEQGHRLLAVEIPHAIGLKLGDGHLSLALHLAQSVGGVEVGNL